jgi:hypothetical protein
VTRMVHRILFPIPIPIVILIVVAVCALRADVVSASVPMPLKTQLSQDFAGTTARFGTAVAIDDDTLVIGAPFADLGPNPGQGAIFIYTRDRSGAWGSPATLLVGNGEDNDGFGSSVALQGDVLLVGAPNARGPGARRQGAVYVFGRVPGNLWLQEARFTSGIGGLSNELFGLSVAFDGNTGVIGQPNAFAGGVWIVNRSGNTWSLMPVALHASDPDTTSGVAWRVAISGDTLIAGSPATTTGGPTRAWPSCSRAAAACGRNKRS